MSDYINEKIAASKESISGLKGIGSLSKQERKDFIDKAVSTGRLSIYHNVLDEANLYNRMLLENRHPERKSEYDKLTDLEIENKLDEDNLNNALHIRFNKGTDENGKPLYDSIIEKLSSLSNEGKRKFLESDILSDSEIEERYSAIKDETKNSSLAEQSFITSPYNTGKIHSFKTPEEILDEYKRSSVETNNTKLEDLIAEDNRVIAADKSIDLTANDYSNILKQKEDKGEVSTLSLFEEIAGPRTWVNKFDGSEGTIPGISEYIAFKDRKELSDFSLSEKRDAVAKYTAIAEKYGSDKARSWLETYIKDYIYDNQDWITRKSNMVKSVGTKATSQLFNEYAGYKALVLATEAEFATGEDKVKKEKIHNNYLQGLDENGNPLPFYENLQYLSDIDMYNTFDESEINKIKKNGGVSPYKNVIKEGDTWSKIRYAGEEAFSMAGYMLPELAKQTVLRGVGRAASSAAGARYTVNGQRVSVPKGIFNPHAVVSEEFSKKLIKSPKWNGTGYYLDKVTAGASVARSGVSEGVLEATMMYNESKADTDQRILNNEDKRAEEYANTHFNEEEFNSLLEKANAKAQKSIVFDQETNSSHVEYSGPNSVSREEGLVYYKDILKKQYKNSAENKARVEQEKYLANKENEAVFATTATIFALKGAAENVAFKKFLFDEGTRAFLDRNYTNARFIERTADNKLKLNVSKAKEIALSMGKTTIGSGLAEWSDTAIENYAKAYGKGSYSDLVKRASSGETISDYSRTATDIIKGINDGLNAAAGTLVDGEAWYEGFIGALSSVLSPKPSSRITKSGKRRFTISTPVIDEWRNTTMELTNAQKILDAAGESYEKNKDLLTSPMELIASLHRLDAASVPGDEEQNKKSEKERRDAKDELAVKLAGLYNNLKYNSVMTENYTEAKEFVDRIEGMKDGTLEEYQDIVDNYKNQPENLGKQLPTDQQIFERIQKNANQIVTMADRIHTAMNEFLSTERGRTLAAENKDALGYYVSAQVINERFKDRKEEIESNYGVTSKESKDLSIRYNTEEKVSKGIDDTNKILQQNKTDLEGANKELERQRVLHQKAIDSNDITKAEQIQKVIDSFNVYIDHLTSQQDELTDKKESLEKLKNKVDDTKIYSEEEIMNMNAQDRYYMLSHKKEFSAEQQKIISALERHQKKINPNFMQDMTDACILDFQIEDNTRQFELIEKHPEEALQFKDLLHNYIKPSTQLVNESRAADAVLQKMQRLVDPQKKLALIRKEQIGNSVIDRIVEQMPELKDIVEPYQNLLKAQGDAVNILKDIVLPNEKEAFLKLIQDATDSSSNEEEFMSELENLIDINPTQRVKNVLDEMLNRMSQLSHQRNATIIEKRGNQKEVTESKETSTQESTNTTEKKEETEKPQEQKQEEPQLKVDPNSVVDEKGQLKEESSLPTEIQPTEDNLKTVEVENEETTDEEEGAENTFTPTPNTLLGNALYRYKNSTLREYLKKKLLRRTPEEGKSLEALQKWEDATKTNIQSIIDNELYQILIADPNTKIRFMMTRPKSNNAQEDKLGWEVIFNVVEVTDEIREIHNNDRGGIIHANGKDYLVVGTAGFSRNSKTQGDAFRKLQNRIKADRNKAQYDGEYFVDENLYTQIQEVNSGRLVLMLEGDTQVTPRTLGQLIESPERNPDDVSSFNSLAFGIQKRSGENSGFMFIRRGDKSCVIPCDKGLAGKAYVFIRAVNGKYIPAALRTVTLNEIDQKGELYQEILRVIANLRSSDYNTRLKAIKEFSRLLVRQKDGNDILIGSPEDNTLKIMKNGVITDTFNLNENKDTISITDAIMKVGFPINITEATFNSAQTINIYDKAGALVTDVASLATVNGSYSIYEVGDDGTPIITSDNKGTTAYTKSIDTTQRKKEHSVTYGPNHDTYRVEKGIVYDINGKEVTDEDLSKKVLLALRIKSGTIPPLFINAKTKAQYFLLDDNTVIAATRQGEIHYLSSQDAAKVLNKAKQEEQDKVRQRGIERAYAESINKPIEGESINIATTSIEQIEQIGEVEDVNLDLLFGTTEEKPTQQQESPKTTTQKEPNQNSNTKKRKSFDDLQKPEILHTFVNIATSPLYRKQLKEIAAEKGWDWGKNADSKQDFLINHLDFSKEALENIDSPEAFIENLKKCH